MIGQKDAKIPLIPIEETKSRNANINDTNINCDTNTDTNNDNYDSSKDHETIICDACLKEFQVELVGKDRTEKEEDLRKKKEKLKQGLTHKEFVDVNIKIFKIPVDCLCNLRHHSDTISYKKRIENEIKKETEKNEEEKKKRERCKKLANDIINRGDVTNFIIETAGKFHCGDEKEILIMYFSALTTKIKNSNGMHMNAVGDIGIGKSDIQRTVAFLLPANRIKSGNISPKAIYYGEFLDGIVIFIDDTEISEDLAELMRKTTTQFHQKCEHYVTKDQKYIELIAPAEIVWWINYNFATSDEALNNRFIVFNVDESEDRKRRIHEFITQREKEGRPTFYVDDDVEICRMIFDLLPSCTVRLPFDTQKYYEIQHDMGFRDRNILMDIIKCLALVDYKKREIIPGILTIDANDEDFRIAGDMWNYIFNDSSGKKCEKKRDNMTNLERNIYKLLIENPIGYFVGDIALKLDKSIQNVSRSLSNLKNKRSDIDYQDESVPVRDTNGIIIKTVHRRRYLISGLDISNCTIYEHPIFESSEEEKGKADDLKENRYMQRHKNKYSERTGINTQIPE